MARTVSTGIDSCVTCEGWGPVGYDGGCTRCLIWDRTGTERHTGVCCRCPRTTRLDYTDVCWPCLVEIRYADEEWVARRTRPASVTMSGLTADVRLPRIPARPHRADDQARGDEATAAAAHPPLEGHPSSDRTA
ncbi:hypothetical protein GCM10022206_09120 [Streptomyces chiangmaiensis]